jgi:pimeloyl-ACP methyl ester carboxylesterase
VLVHGAWGGSWCWERVVPLLEQAGLAVRTVDLPSVGAPAGDPAGLSDDAAAVIAVLDAVDGPVVLCGHSYGGMVVTQAAAGRTDVSHLVYVCAFMPDAGDSLFSITGGPAPWIELLEDGRTIPKREHRETVSYADCDPETRAAAVARLRPQVTGPFGGEVAVAAWRAIPSTYVVCAQDESLPVELQRDVFAPRAAHVVELASSHSPFFSQPERLVDVIVQQASA